MPYCYCPGCSHVSRRETCSFYRFPVNKKAFILWKKMCRRADRDPTREDRLCSCHFRDGNKLLGPTIVPWNKDGIWKFPSPKKERKKTKVLDETSAKVEAAKRTILDTPQIDIEETMEVGPSTSSTPALDNAELYFLKQENIELESGEKRFGFSDISGDDTLVFKYTGLPTAAHFTILCSLICRFELKYYNGWKVEVLSYEDQVLCTLMKLRLNLHFFDLAFRFKISSTTVHNIVMTYVYAIHDILYIGMMENIPSREKNSLFVPTCFRYFQNCRIVLDCTEIKVAIPGSLKLKKAVFSHYKQRHTFKVLIGVAPNATITFVSDLFPGAISDKVITEESGILHHMKAGDLILADKGFLIKDMCKELGVTVNIPPFLNNPQFTVEEILATRKIARARIHVERAINRLKNFKILDFIMANMSEHSTVIVKACAAVVNLQYALLRESEQCFQLLPDSDF